MAELQLISSDSHVSEPPDLWVERLDTRYRGQAPRLGLNPTLAGYGAGRGRSSERTSPSSTVLI